MIAETLSSACRLWSRLAALAYPAYGAPPIVLRPDPQATTPVEFYTDKQSIFVCLNQPGPLEADWRGHIVPLYAPDAALLYPGAGAVAGDELASALWLDTVVFVLLHELYHPLVCPNSLDDEKAITLALFRGVRTALPGLQSLDQLHGADHLKNLVWDLVVNTTYLARLAGAGYDPLAGGCRHVFAAAGRRVGSALVASPPAAVVPALYVLSARQATTDLLIGIMGALYVYLSAVGPALRDRLLGPFRVEGQRLGCPRPPDVLALELLQALTAGTPLAGEAHYLSSADADLLHSAQRTLLSGLLRLWEQPNSRYRAVEIVGRFLAPFLRGDAKQGSLDAATCGHRCDSPGEGGAAGAGSAADTLQDLMETLPDDEVEDLIRKATRPAAGTTPADGTGGGTGEVGWTPLTIAAADEFYRRHSAPLSFHSPDARAVGHSIGKQQQWRWHSSQTLTAAEVSQLDLERVLAFQTATGLPVLLGLAPGYYQLNEFVLRVTPLKSYVRSLDVEVPDNWVLLLDSSGSMASTAYVASGEHYDLLMRVCYGVAQGLAAVAEALKKDVRIGVVGFSSATVFSGLMSLGTALAGHLNPVKRTLLVPQCGGTTVDLAVLAEVEAALPPGRTIYTLITDGEIDNGPEVVAYLRQWAVPRGRALVFIQIGPLSGTGEELQRAAATQPAIVCFQVERVEEIAGTLGSMLVRYTS